AAQSAAVKSVTVTGLTSAAPVRIATSDKPFTVSVAGSQPRSFDTLAAALTAASENAVIEVYSNGPFQIGNVRHTKKVTLRAAADYRPTFVATEAAGEGWFNFERDAAIEGCDFYRASASAGGVVIRAAGATCELRGCRFLALANSIS